MALAPSATTARQAVVHALLVLGADCADELREFVTPDACGFEVHAEATVVGAANWAASASRTAVVRAVVVALADGRGEPNSGLDLISELAGSERIAPFALRVVYSPDAVDNVLTRQHCAQVGAHMVTHDRASLLHVLRQVAAEGTGSGGGFLGPLYCPFCGRGGLSEDELWTHMPLFHVNDKRRPTVKCCDKPCNIFRHVHNKHGPCDSRRLEHPSDGNSITYLSAFALVVCRRESDGRFLLTQERRSEGYWLPGGHVDAGEAFEAAAVRETLEEAGVAVRLTGVLRVEFSPDKAHSRIRVIFLAEPLDEAQPAKTVPDFESGGAAWVDYAHIAGGVTMDELHKERKTRRSGWRATRTGGTARAGAGTGRGRRDAAAKPTKSERTTDARLHLRGDEPREWGRYVVDGGVAFPLSILTMEGAPAPRVTDSETVLEEAGQASAADAPTSSDTDSDWDRAVVGKD